MRVHKKCISCACLFLCVCTHVNVRVCRIMLCTQLYGLDTVIIT